MTNAEAVATTTETPVGKEGNTIAKSSTHNSTGRSEHLR
eukprot:CAMPEP_0178730846 /NCGR_PEP_ID=MMETSP0699-20121125/29735_1 /TAXON_ID=265572 /ORGANISM="Extubocellulus spinifer, Strain CCMP396" /LENGTH=38 /DNA_ID= /DNA_START= /DNA_END= /DNA_ORIENTATION=